MFGCCRRPCMAISAANCASWSVTTSGSRRFTTTSMPPPPPSQRARCTAPKPPVPRCICSSSSSGAIIWMRPRSAPPRKVDWSEFGPWLTVGACVIGDERTPYIAEKPALAAAAAARAAASVERTCPGEVARPGIEVGSAGSGDAGGDANDRCCWCGCWCWWGSTAKLVTATRAIFSASSCMYSFASPSEELSEAAARASSPSSSSSSSS
mmetsp:Transcript_12883/g.42517  ORF Transcript_12883/g.42517 Transcript_12883/m.42517 type:complete len:210 (+) Transcript_12883:788-1417(+)